MNATILSKFTLNELLFNLESKRHHSPIIDELCKRLEANEENDKEANPKVECPVCMAKLLVNYDPNNQLFEIEIDPD